MGYVFEELIRKFNEENNEEAGEHFTPREVIKLWIEYESDRERKCCRCIDRVILARMVISINQAKVNNAFSSYSLP
jgi:hypothetical protein